MNTASNIRHTMLVLVTAMVLAAQLVAGLGANVPRTGTVSTSTAASPLPQLPEVVVTARRLPAVPLPF